MAPRAYWKGYLKLSLVTCPIALYPAASSSERVSFRRINKKTGNRLRQQNVDSDTGEVVDRDDTGRGYEVGKNQFIQVKDEELENISVESTHTIDIDQFVPREEVDDRYIDSTYYVAPTDEVGAEAFAVIRDSIKVKKMAALGRVVLAKREHVVMLEPFDKGLIACTLHYPYEIRDSKMYFEDIPDIKLPKEMLDLAEHIVETKSGHFDPSQFEDHYETALIELLRKKQAGAPIEKTPTPAPRPSNVVNIMDALRKSLEGETGSRQRGARPPAKRENKQRRRTTTKSKKAS
jgi:DNA end-binding protein Ku